MVLVFLILCHIFNTFNLFSFFSLVIKVIPANYGGRIKVSVIETHHLAESVHLKVTTPLPLDTTQLENAFHYQYEGHPFTKGTYLILKDFGKTWMVLVDNVINISDPLKPSSPFEIETKMGLLTVGEQKSAAPIYSIILPQTKIFFNPSSTESNSHNVESIGLSDFGGNQAIIDEVLKMCSSIFCQTSTLNRNSTLTNFHKLQQ